MWSARDVSSDLLHALFGVGRRQVGADGHPDLGLLRRHAQDALGRGLGLHHAAEQRQRVAGAVAEHAVALLVEDVDVRRGDAAAREPRPLHHAELGRRVRRADAEVLGRAGAEELDRVEGGAALAVLPEAVDPEGREPQRLGPGAQRLVARDELVLDDDVVGAPVHPDVLVDVALLPAVGHAEAELVRVGVRVEHEVLPEDVLLAQAVRDVLQDAVRDGHDGGGLVVELFLREARHLPGALDGRVVDAEVRLDALGPGEGHGVAARHEALLFGREPVGGHAPQHRRRDAAGVSGLDEGAEGQHDVFEAELVAEEVDDVDVIRVRALEAAVENGMGPEHGVFAFGDLELEALTAHVGGEARDAVGVAHVDLGLYDHIAKLTANGLLDDGLKVVVEVIAGIPGHDLANVVLGLVREERLAEGKHLLTDPVVGVVHAGRDGPARDAAAVDLVADAVLGLVHGADLDADAVDGGAGVGGGHELGGDALEEEDGAEEALAALAVVVVGGPVVLLALLGAVHALEVRVEGGVAAVAVEHASAVGLAGGAALDAALDAVVAGEGVVHAAGARLVAAVVEVGVGVAAAAVDPAGVLEPVVAVDVGLAGAGLAVVADGALVAGGELDLVPVDGRDLGDGELAEELDEDAADGAVGALPEGEGEAGGPPVLVGVLVRGRGDDALDARVGQGPQGEGDAAVVVGGGIGVLEAPVVVQDAGHGDEEPVDGVAAHLVVARGAVEVVGKAVLPENVVELAEVLLSLFVEYVGVSSFLEGGERNRESAMRSEMRTGDEKEKRTRGDENERR
ncbi:hypothetical protein CTA1_5341 [Colletotrichum tanaceti]|uniref:Uncharacterized protein n=1 Tax=Colletotrichum tanaceti TaxID=1306861 RepID=A0A4U6XGN8_9PEZI|nr:hypothetical protein CTA1_5341 [Colletotrichum tanaceti]